jgi:hypothetical protein
MSILRREVKVFRQWGVPLSILLFVLSIAIPANAAVPARLKDGLSSSSVKVRVIAVAAVAKTKDPEAAALLRPMLGDPEAAVRAAAVDGLVLLKDLGAAAAIAKLKDDPDAAVRAVVGRGLPKLSAALIQVDTGDLSDLRGKASPELLDRLRSTFEAELQKQSGGVNIQRGGAQKGLGAMLKIRSITKGSDGANEFIEVKCDLTLVELPGKILRVSSTANAAAGVEGKMPAKMEAELAKDGIDACAPSLAKDFADYIVTRAGKR